LTSSAGMPQGFALPDKPAVARGAAGALGDRPSTAAPEYNPGIVSRGDAVASYARVLGILQEE
jgi:hypothetical protein